MKNGVPMGSRTPVTGVKGPCPRPLDDGDVVWPGVQVSCVLYIFKNGMSSTASIILNLLTAKEKIIKISRKH